MSNIANIGFLFVLAPGLAFANQPSAYVGQQQREIKALSPQELQDYLDGKGMGFAKAAELNHFPGPLHVLQSADQLQLTQRQKAQTEQLYDAMQETKILGKILVDKEQELNQLFASANIDTAGLRLLVAEIGRVQAEIRKTHLQAHLEQKRILTPDQIAAYDKLRGYKAKDTPPHQSSAHSH
jgi:Spy/CpxP family protein refolding chaperone